MNLEPSGLGFIGFLRNLEPEGLGLGVVGILEALNGCQESRVLLAPCPCVPGLRESRAEFAGGQRVGAGVIRRIIIRTVRNNKS